MTTVDYVVRDGAGSVQRGTFAEGDPSTIYVSYSKDVSLNLNPSDVAGYKQHGNDLLITLQNGQVLVLSGYFDEGATGDKHLFLSEGGDFVEVILADGPDGAFYASYDAIDVSGKWSAYDQLTFLDIGNVEQVVAPLAAPLLGPLGLIGGGAAAAGAVVLTGGGGGGGDDGDGGGGGGVITPTVDDPNATYELGGTGPDSATVTGTGTPGSTVTVTVGGQEQIVTIDANGVWTATFDPQVLPADGVYQAEVNVVDPAGNTWDLTGPTVDIDTTPPTVDVDSGTQSTGDLVNAAGHATGATITGTGEAGATVAVEIAGTTHTTTVDANGNWSVTFATGEIAEGEYNSDITITTTDARGNFSTSTEVLVVDTVAPPIDLNTVEGDDVINTAEASDGVTLAGTGEAGASISVVFQGITRTATVDANGNWSMDFAASEIAAGTYDSSVVITSTDAAGNSSTSTHSVHVDTEASVTVGAVEGDDVINSAEAADGVTLTGTAEAGASVSVEFQGITRTTTADANGNWTMDFAASEIAQGTYDAAVDVTSTDAAGNVTLATHQVHVDTDQSVTVSTQVGTDNAINQVEQAAGVNLTGTAEPGSSVVVTMGAVSHTVTAGVNGTWNATFAASEIPTGTYDATVTAVATDAAGNTASTTGTIQVDTETNVNITPGFAGGDGIVNAAEAGAGVTFNGTAEAGASVMVTVAGVTRAATVDANGNWSATYAAGSLTPGEYDTTISVTSTDAVGNTATSSTAIRIDTDAGDVALSTVPIEIDDVINAVERGDGVIINGTATPGLTVTVGLGTATQLVVADGNGNWSTTFPPSSVPTGTQNLGITASITDAAGNSASASDSVQLDTVVDNYALNSGSIEGDNVINEVERSDGVSLTGTVEPGSTVMVQLGGATQAAIVDSAGNWQVNFAAGSIPQGTYDAPITVTATDPAGNVEVINDQVRVDTDADLTVNPSQTADDVVNAVERAAGVTLNGTAEPGSTVQVVLQGVTQTAAVDGNGNWVTTFDAATLPEGTYNASATITATDPAGNTSTLTETFAVDTEVATPDVDSVTFSRSDVRRISTEDALDNYEVNTLESNGTVGTPAATVSSDPTFGTEFTFNTPIPNGTNLMVSREDSAGNASSTLVVMEDSATSISHAGLAGFDIQALNLEYSADSDLVLTEADIKALSGSTDTVTIHGGIDDQITVAGAQNTGTTQIDGQTYNVYTLGNDGVTLVIEQDVTVII